MEKNLKIVFALLLLLVPFVVPVAFSLDPLTARLLLILSLLLPVVLILSYSAKLRSHSWFVPLLVIMFLVVPTLVFVVRNAVRFNIFFEGIEPSESRMLAEQYAEQGTLLWETSHSSFFQTPFLIFLLSSLCGLSLVQASLMIIALHIGLIAVVSLYVAGHVRNQIENPRYAFLPYLIAFSLLACSNMMYTNIAYRYLGSDLLVLFLFFYYKQDSKGRSKRSLYIVSLALTIGITLGDPTGALLLVILFPLVAIFRRSFSMMGYAIIPATYLLFSAIRYMLILKTYATFAWQGFYDFFQEVIFGRLPTRVLPWGRVIMPTVQDSFLTSAAYLSLLLLSGIVGLVSVLLWTRHKVGRDGTRAAPFFKATTIALIVMLGIGLVTYFGTSTRPEVSFSDIRTIVMIFSSILLLFSLASKTLLKALTSRKTILVILSALLIFTSLRVIYDSYPKSIQDPVNVVEDPRIDLRASYFLGKFFDSYVRGNVISDSKSRISLSSTSYNIILLSNSSLDAHFNSLIVFNLNGLRLLSIYVSQEAYQQAYALSLTLDVIYSSGNVTIVKG